MRYGIWDPTGNITALVMDDVPIIEQPEVAARIMARHAEVEQVGFVSDASELDRVNGVLANMRMAGGEFCGNATICAAASCLVGESPVRGGDHSLLLRASGTDSPVQVILRRTGEKAFDAEILMPRARNLEERCLAFRSLSAPLTIVHMDGISHVVIPRDSPFDVLRYNKHDAERAVRLWCDELGTGGLGLMFLGEGPLPASMTPLVYVPGSNTVFWESSCASGTSAVGMCLATDSDGLVDVSLKEPGGTLRVTSDPSSGETWLYGRTRLVELHEL